MQITDSNGNVFGVNGLEVTGPDGKPKTTGGGVTAVTASAPIASTGGATPNISIATSDTSTTGALSDIDWNKFNNKLSGVHALFPIVSGVPISAQLTGLVTAASAVTANVLRAHPFIPNQSFTSVSLSVNVTTSQAGVAARILIYSSLNGKPDQKLYESANLDCSTTGIKTALLSFTFTVGVTYWLCSYFSNAIPLSLTHHTGAALLYIGNVAFTIGITYSKNVTFGTAPTTFGVASLSTGIPVAIIINPA